MSMAFRVGNTSGRRRASIKIFHDAATGQASKPALQTYARKGLLIYPLGPWSPFTFLHGAFYLC